MKTQTKLSLILITCLLALGACGPGEIQPLLFQPPAWADGEFSAYDVTDVNGAYAGTLRFDIARAPGEDAWQIRREIATQGTLEIVAVEIAGKGFRPQHAEQIRSDHLGQEQVHTIYSGTRAELELTTRQDVTTFERVNIPSDVRDDTTLLMLIRSLPLEPGYATRLNIFTPIMGTTERITVHVTRRESVETTAGVFDAWKVTVTGRDRNQRIQAWVAVDAPHPVVKFIDGRNRGTFEMSDFQSGAP